MAKKKSSQTHSAQILAFDLEAVAPVHKHVEQTKRQAQDYTGLGLIHCKDFGAYISKMTYNDKEGHNDLSRPTVHGRGVCENSGKARE